MRLEVLPEEMKMRDHKAVRARIMRSVPLPASLVQPPVIDVRKRYVPKARIIVAEVCAAHAIATDAVKSRKRDMRHSSARRTIAKRLHDELNYSSERIGRIIGRNHSTVLYLIGATADSKSRPCTRQVDIGEQRVKVDAVIKQVCERYRISESRLLSRYELSVFLEKARTEVVGRLVNDVGMTIHAVQPILKRGRVVLNRFHEVYRSGLSGASG
jgi:Bacterial dnaA protein helix-turn-helix